MMEMNKKSEAFLKKISDKLPHDLEIYEINARGYSWEVRPKGNWFNWGRPSITILSNFECFEIECKKDTSLAKRLHKLFPNIPFIISTFNYNFYKEIFKGETIKFKIFNGTYMIKKITTLNDFNE